VPAPIAPATWREATAKNSIAYRLALTACSACQGACLCGIREIDPDVTQGSAGSNTVGVWIVDA